MRPLCVRSHVAVMRAALSEGIICRYKVSTVKTNVSGRTTPPMEPRTWRSIHTPLAHHHRTACWQPTRIQLGAPPPAAASRFPARPVRAGSSRGDLSFYPGEARSLTAPLLQLPGRLKSCHHPAVPHVASGSRRLLAASERLRRTPPAPIPGPRAAARGDAPWSRRVPLALSGKNKSKASFLI